MRITVIGTGYVGTVTGACLSYLGHHVTCVDLDPAKIKMLQRGEIPIYEPHLDKLLEAAHKKGGVEFTTRLEDSVPFSDVVFIAVGTPPLASGESNLTYLEAAARSIGSAMDSSRFRIVINKSTVPIGSGNLVETLVREGIREAGKDESAIRFSVASNPEFLREGCAIGDSLYGDRIVVGSEDAEAIEMLRELYRPLVDQSFEAPSFLPRPAGFKGLNLLTTSLTSAEMIKYAANAFLATKISFANEISNICERVGADTTEVMKGIGLDSRIGPKFLNAGLGWGGSCFGKDIKSIVHTAKEYGYRPRLLEATLEVNSDQRMLAVQKLQEKLYILKGRTISLLGLAFKPDTDDLRDAPSLQIAEKLLQMGARVRVFDPIAMERCRHEHPNLRLQYCDSAMATAADADGCVLVTEWDEFRDLDLTEYGKRMHRRILVDGRNHLDPAVARAAGFEYTGIGRTPRTGSPSHSSASELLPA